MAEALADAGKSSQKGCPKPTPPGPEPPPRPPFSAQEVADLSPGRGWRGLVAQSQVMGWPGHLAALCHQAWHLLPAWGVFPKL